MTADESSSSQGMSATPPASRGHSSPETSRSVGSTIEVAYQDEEGNGVLRVYESGRLVKQVMVPAGMEFREDEPRFIDGYTAKETMDMIWENSKEQGWK